MFRKIGLPIAAVAGIFFSIYIVHRGSKKPPVVRVLFPPPVSPYDHYIAGEGLIESSYKNIPLTVPFQELVANIYVKVGDVVKQGDLLFSLDTRQLEARLIEALQEQRLAEIDYENQRVQFSFYERVKDRAAVSERAYEAAFYLRELAQKKVDIAKAAVMVIKTNIERYKICAPVDGEVLQLNIRVGQTAQPDATGRSPLILFGDTAICHLRVDVDEDNAWRITNGKQATAFVRGNSKISIPLEFVYLEPYMVPKVSLSSASTERIDTRVLQLVYKFSKKDIPVFVGQILDVYIQAEPNGAGQ